MSLPIFDRQFAVPLISLIAVFMLPAVYLFAINSPTLMVGLADMLRTHVYQLDELAAQSQSYQRSRKVMRDIRGSLREARRKANDDLQPLAEREQAKRSLQAQRRALRKQRKQLQEAYPDLPKLQRADRFHRKFLKRNGVACSNGQLCGGGEDRALNAQLLLHLITDEVSSLFVDEEVRYSAVGRIANYLLPVVLVPIVLGLIAILWVLVAQVLARGFSRIASRWLDRMTWTQIRRSAVGNDTEDEIALGTAPYPAWVGGGQPFLPLAVSAEITQCSNDATFKSVGKFRDALSDLAFTEGKKRDTDNVLAYLNWNELIHTCYFAVPSFTSLVAMAIVRSGGFRAAPALEEAARLQEWLGDSEFIPSTAA